MLRRIALLGTALSVVLTLLADLPARSAGVTPVHTLADSQVWDDGVPEILVDSRGWTTAVWTKDPGAGALSVWSATKRPGQPWSSAVQLSPASPVSAFRSMAVAPDGTLWVMWERSIDGEGRIEVARRSPAGAWSAPVLVSAPGFNVNTGQIAVNRFGTAVAVWSHYDLAADNFRVFASRAGSNGVWSTPTPLTPAAVNALVPQVAASPAADGSFHAIWIAEDAVSGYQRIQGRSMTRGVWRAADWVSPPDGDGNFPVVDVRGDGRAVAVWTYEKTGQDPQIQRGYGAAGGTWGLADYLSGGVGGASEPALAVYGETGVVFAWTRFYQDLGPRIQVRRVGDGSQSSTADLGTVGDFPRYPRVASTPSGRTVVSWEQLVSGNFVTHAVQGVPGQAWSTPQQFSAFGTHAQVSQVAVDPSGDAVLLWRQASIDATVHGLQTATWDTTRPGATRPTVRSRVSTKTTKVRWSVSDDWSGVTSRLGARSAGWKTRNWSPWATLQTSTAESRTVTLTSGRTTCFRVRPTDTAANVGVETAARCATTPVDDRTATASPGWTKGTAASAYRRTLRSTTRKGATLSLPGARVRHVALLVSRVPGGGKVRVYLGRRLLSTVSVAGPSKARHVIGVKKFPTVRTWTIRLVVATSGKPVRIDGIFVGR